MNNFWARTITGLSMVFLLLFSLWYSNWLFAGIFLVVVILGIWEFYTLFSSEEIQPQKIYGTVCASILYLVLYLVNATNLDILSPRWYFFPVYAAMAMFFLSFIIEIYRKKQKPLENIAITAAGVLYVSLPLSLLNLLYSPDSARFLGFPAFLLGYFTLTWLFDTAAYLYGKSFGKHKLFERISPKKTWEGTIAGAILAGFTALVFSLLVPDIVMMDWLMLSFLVVIFGSFGDLAESLFKRSLKIKDSGNILPGHGGILDRFDTFFISAPFVFLYFVLRNI
ncbi:MAG: phosphatidate cytidylyltransferase [Bacteroidetes bacterium]|nr:phosphatidate cytidylyltransferase [Bacteroidota bacterium]